VTGRQWAPALLAAALLGGVVPGASADDVRAECRYLTVASEAVTGSQDRFTGAAYGAAVFDDEATHALRCYVTVNGVERSSTPTGTGTGVVVTAGQVTYEDDFDVVALCTEVDGVTTGCREEPPEPCSDCGGPLPDWVGVLLDMVNGASATYVDPVVCPLLASSSPGVPGVVDVTPAGDVTVVGVGLLWDCPPYGE
jgi:hypothetical protein